MAQTQWIYTEYNESNKRLTNGSFYLRMSWDGKFSLASQDCPLQPELEPEPEAYWLYLTTPEDFKSNLQQHGLPSPTFAQLQQIGFEQDWTFGNSEGQSFDEDISIEGGGDRGVSKPKRFFRTLAKFLNHAGGFLTGLATFWLYIPAAVKAVLNLEEMRRDSTIDSILRVLAVVFFPVTLALVALGTLALVVVSNSYFGFLETWRTSALKFDIDFEVDDEDPEFTIASWYQMPINFLSGVLGWVVGIALTVAFYPLMKTLNYVRACLDVITSETKEPITIGLKLRAALKLLFVTPFVFALQLLAAPFRGLYYGKDGLGRVLQTFWDTLNERLMVSSNTLKRDESGDHIERESAKSDKIGEDNDYVSIGLSEVLFISAYVAVIAFAIVAMTLAAAPTGAFASFILGALSWTGFTAGASTLFTAFAGAGIASALTFVGTALFAGMMKGLMGLAKAVGWFGESTTDVIYGTADRMVGKENELEQKYSLKGAIRAKAEESTETREAEIAGAGEDAYGTKYDGTNSFDAVFEAAMPDCVESITEAFRPGPAV